MEMTLNSKRDTIGHLLFDCKIVSETGRVIKKTLSVAGLVKLLNGSLRDDTTYSRVPKNFIPEGYVDGCICDASNFYIIWKAKPKKRVVVYKEKIFSIPFPTILFALKVKNGFIQSKECFCMKEGDDDTLYNYPFGNVNNYGSICMGNIKFDPYTEIGAAKQFENDFFEGETNDDLLYQNQVAVEWSQGEMFNKLEKEERFPENWLTESRVKMSDLIKEIDTLTV